MLHDDHRYKAIVTKLILKGKTQVNDIGILCHGRHISLSIANGAQVELVAALG